MCQVFQERCKRDPELLSKIITGDRKQDVVKGKRAKLTDTSAKFQTVPFKKCFEWWCDCWAH